MARVAGRFVSSDQARRACPAELEQVSIIFPMGTYSGQPLGDCCWVSPMINRRFGRLVFCFGNCAASVDGAVTDLASEEPLDYMLLESVARRLLANMPGGLQLPSPCSIQPLTSGAR